MNRRKFLNTLGISALGAGAGAAFGSIMFAIPAYGAERVFCNLCGSLLLGSGCSNSACEASHTGERALDEDFARAEAEHARGPKSVMPPDTRKP